MGNFTYRQMLNLLCVRQIFSTTRHERWWRYRQTPTKEGAVMIFNNKCEVRYNHDKELVSLMKDYTANPYF